MAAGLLHLHRLEMKENIMKLTHWIAMLTLAMSFSGLAMADNMPTLPTGKMSQESYNTAKAKADTAYDAAKMKCDRFSGNAKDVCITEAKAAKAKSEASAKMTRETTEARQEAGEVSREVEYKIEIEKCDQYSGDAKESCLSSAKAKFGK